MSDENKDEAKKGSWDSLLTLEDEKSDGEEYIKPNIEHKLPAHKRKECRDIIQEIRAFGISQRQMLYLIYLMSLELEDVSTMRALVKVIGEHRENTPVLHTADSSSSSKASQQQSVILLTTDSPSPEKKE